MNGTSLDDFISNLAGASLIYADPNLVKDKRLKTIFPSENADLVVCDSIDSLRKIKRKNKSVGYYKKVVTNEDLDEISEASKEGAQFVIVDATDWTLKFRLPSSRR